MPRQSAHDRAVRKLAEDLISKRFKVRADLPGYERPEPVGRKTRVVPDIEATRGKVTRLVEVETPSTMQSEQAKQQAAILRRSAAQREGVTFELIVTEEG